MYNKKIISFVDKTLGYLYFCDHKHPLANKSGKVYLHRHIVSLREGRWVKKDEIVHHIDGNKRNNNPFNFLKTGVYNK